MKEEKKPRHMTSLNKNRLVSKTHGRIAFRGIIDTLEAEVIEAQVLAAGLGESGYCAKLGEILDYLRSLMSAEVNETPLPPPFLFGMDEEEIHRQSHSDKGSTVQPEFVQLPSYTQGPLSARLNTLRAKIREAELLAVKTLDGRDDIILAMNRLSSALWWLYCESLQ